MKRVLIVGPDFHGYNLSIGRAFEAFGFAVHVLYLPTYHPPGFLNKIRATLSETVGNRKFIRHWKKKINDEFLEQAECLKPDLILIIKGQWIEPNTLERLYKTKIAIWFQDEVSRCTPDYIKLSNLANRVFVFEGKDVDKLRIEADVPAIFLPMGFDPLVYFPKNIHKDVDVSFVGFPYENRRILLEKLSRDLKGYKLRFYGRYLRYKEPYSWLLYTQRQLQTSHRETFINADLLPVSVNNLYARSKIVLNIHHQQSQDGCNPRVFEIMGAGSLQLVDKNPYLAKHLSGVLTLYEDYEHLLGLIGDCLANPSWRARQSEAACSESINHTFEKRVERLLSHI